MSNIMHNFGAHFHQHQVVNLWTEKLIALFLANETAERCVDDENYRKMRKSCLL